MKQDNTIHYEEEQTIQLPVHILWEQLSDSNHLNHYIGLFPVRFSPFRKEEGGEFYRSAEAKAFCIIPVEWKEQVFSWVRDEWYEVERVYEKGPVERVVWQVHTRAETAETSFLKLKGTFTYRNALGRMMLSHVILPKLRETFGYAASFEENQSMSLPRPQTNARIEADDSLLETRIEKLKEEEVPTVMANRLQADILHLDNEEVNAIRPYRWAKIYGFDRRETVRLFLLATKMGILEQHWSMLCPNCRVPKATASTLKDVSGQVHCDLCGVDYDVDFDRLIEMQFRPHESIRKVRQDIYCLNGPVNAPHIIAQFRLAPGSSDVMIPVPQTDVRFRVLGHNFTAGIDTENTTTVDTTLTITREGFDAAFYTPGTSLTVHNRNEEETVLVMEETQWNEDALTAKELTSLQLFRDLFATEVLSPDQEIHISNMTILFTDLRGSTSMYEKVGDAPAYADVRKHFDFIRDIVRKHEGSIVKTIGDSVMAAFSKETNAFHAAMQIQKDIEDLREKVQEPLEIKVGMHSGPVIAVNANDLLDYFGHTVNVASRIEQKSRGNDIVLTSDLFESMKEDLDGWESESSEEHLRGIEEDVELVYVKRDTSSSE
ncbi:adenylate/guanylate cyclase domain-containing protein [Salimicrobium halophilum]|uniref:Adenylate cyclase, class 3 n=1 Tax=Salimicrobium halophilum TaxID=86666 RepID=A0A1G8UWT8_9BACI|nr:adenylate/guanylate cyclase domain-containing protein [Salimicrobium halophilum]SDJ58027.1 Adenylate cyclase, class 3 [Salimicrobium halophilum]